MVHSVSSASSLKSQTWKEWLIHQRVLYRLEKWNHMKFKKESAKSCTWGATAPCTSKYWGNILCWKADCQKRTCGSWWTPSWASASSVSLQQRRLMVSHVALDKGLPAGWGKWSYSSTWHWWGHAWSAVSCSGLPTTREMSSGQSDTNILKGQKHPSSEERLDCLAQRRDGSGTISHTWNEGAKRAESVVPSDWIRVNRNKMKLRSFPSEH